MPIDHVPEKNPRRLYLNVPDVGASFSTGWIKNPEAKPKLGWKGAESKKGIHDPKSCSCPSKKTFNGRRPKFEKEKKIKRKRKYAERQERDDSTPKN